MINKGLFSKLYIDNLRNNLSLDDAAEGRMATLAQAWQKSNTESLSGIWESFVKQSLGFLEFVTHPTIKSDGVVTLYDDWDFANPICVVCLVDPQADINDYRLGRFWPGRLIAELTKKNLNYGILTNGSHWRLYSTKSAKPYEDYVDLDLEATLADNNTAEYALFENFFHAGSFVAQESDDEASEDEKAAGVYSCELDLKKAASEEILEAKVKSPFLFQVDEVMQYICNGFIYDTRKTGEDYTEEERKEIFQSAVKLLYRCLFLFYAESRSLLPSKIEKEDAYSTRSIRALCHEAHKFQWGLRNDTDEYDLWKHLKGLINAVNDGDPEYGIIGYNGGLFDDEQEYFLGNHRLRNDFLARALYLMAYVAPPDADQNQEYEIPYEDLEVRHLGELYENILEFNVTLAVADRVRRRTTNGVQIILLSETERKSGDSIIKKGEVYFAETALERKQSGSYYTPESLVRFINQKVVIKPLQERFARHRQRFDNFVEQAEKGRDEATRRGSLQSASALLDSFIRNEVLTYTICDPAMGSGHFLVNAVNQTTGFVISLLCELPFLENVHAEISTDPNYWRRLITRHCIYGVDLNPLSTHLSKLSLWLNCFARDHKLTFLDHHLRCGNSLIGVRTIDDIANPPLKNKERKKKNPKQLSVIAPSGFNETLEYAAATIAEIASADEDDTDFQKESFEDAYKAAKTNLGALADLRTGFLMGDIMTLEEYGQLYAQLVRQKGKPLFSDSGLQDIWKEVEKLQNNHQFFHWMLEFPTIFGPTGTGGFNATVGNPPWDIVKPNSQEFFSAYLPGFRALEKQAANKQSKRLMADSRAIAEKWEKYCVSFSEQSTYFREQDAYHVLGQGDINTYKLFLEQFFTLLRNGGHEGIVVPSGVYTDKGCQPLREQFFDQSKIDCLYCFENKKAIFNIHRSFKFVVFCTEKGKQTTEFKCAFMQHDPEKLPVIEERALKMSVEKVRKFSPETLSVMEFNTQLDIDITGKIYGDWPLLGEKVDDSWNVKFNAEFHMTSASHLFKSEPTPWPLYEGKMIWQFDSAYENPRYWLDYDEAVEALGDASWEMKKYRVAFRDIGRSTDERTLISSVLPPSVHGNTLPTIVPFQKGISHKGVNNLESLFLSALLCSHCIEYIIRQKVSAHMNFFYMNTLPIARVNSDSGSKLLIFLHAITVRAARLISTNQSFAELWTSVFNDKWNDKDFWYPGDSAMADYGPKHEQDIRIRLQDQADHLKDVWTPECGVYDRLPDRRDTGDRAQLRAEIDAYVAHLYGISREDFSYILDTFPVLQRKEEAAFGEFISKRKCLEEYDRIAQIL